MFEVDSDENFISYYRENKPDIAIIYGDNQLARSTLSLLGDIISQNSYQTVVIYAIESIEDISVVELVEKSKFSYLPLKLASKYRMLRLINSRITFELLKRDYVIPKKK